MTSENKEVCTQCPNHCPISDLKCGRGRRAMLGEGQEHGEMHERGEGRGHGEGRGRGEGRERRGHGRHHGHGEHGSHDEQSDHHGEHRGMHEEDSLAGLMHATGHFLHRRGRQGGGQEGILAILAEKGQMSQKELQDILRIQPGSISEILSKLEMKGLIIRQKDEDDRRKSIVQLTDEGRSVLEKGNPRMDETALFEVLNAEEQAELKRLLKKLLDFWKN